VQAVSRHSHNGHDGARAYKFCVLRGDGNKADLQGLIAGRRRGSM
jgi:hypothetical protein